MAKDNSVWMDEAAVIPEDVYLALRALETPPDPEWVEFSEEEWKRLADATQKQFRVEK